MNCERAEKAERASNPGNLPTSLLLISRMDEKNFEEKNAFFCVFLTVLVQFWFLTRGGTYLDIFAKKWEKLTSPGIFRCSFIYKTQGLCSFDPTKLFLPPYGGSENMPLLQKKWALGEKAVCKLYVGNMAFFHLI